MIYKLYKQLCEELMDEAVYPASFDLDHFKSLTTFKARVQYCNSTLQRLGSGSSRIAYLIDEVTVLKLAKNTKGIDQNEVEIDVSKHVDYGVAKVLEFDSRGLWVESQFAKKITPSRFQQLAGFSLRDLGLWLHNYIAVEKGRRKLYKLSDEINNLITDHPISNTIEELIHSFNLGIGDLGRISSWGEIDGKLVIKDYGFIVDRDLF